MNINENIQNERVPSPEEEREALLRELMPKLGMQSQAPAMKNRAEAWRKYLLPKLLAVLVALGVGAWLFSPVSFKKVEAVAADGGVTVDFSVSKAVLLDSVSAEMAGAPVGTETLSPGSYRVEAPKNGTLTLSARTFFGQVTETTLNITAVDAEPPTVREDELRDGEMYIYLADDGSGVDWGSVKVSDAATGRALDGLDVNEAEDFIRFPFPDAPARVSVADNSGNPLTVLLQLTEEN